MLLKEPLLASWSGNEADTAARLVVRWAMFPTRQEYLPNDYNWGLTAYGLPPGEEFDLDDLIGTNCLIVVRHVERNGNTYDNITSIGPLMEEMESMEPSEDYVREKDRPGGKDVRSPKPPDSPDDFQREGDD